jgi:hypothetical protein
MPVPARIEYEAIGFDVYAEAPLGFLVIEIATSQEAKIALRMRRSTFDDLAERIAKARSDLEKRAPRP